MITWPCQAVHGTVPRRPSRALRTVVGVQKEGQRVAPTSSSCEKMDTWGIGVQPLPKRQ
jgi:hypothetical protein